MSGRFFVGLLIVAVFSAPGFTQELSLSITGRSYTSGEQIWVGLSVLDATAIPGAYKVGVRYDSRQLSFSGILPAEQGPFSVTPAAVRSGEDIVTVAGFQGIVDSGSGNTSLATLIFTPADGAVTVDTSSFSVSSREVFSAQAESMVLSLTKQTTSVLLPSPAVGTLRQKITIVNNYLRFAVPNDGLTSLRIYNLTGRVCATPLSPRYCRAGYHALPLGTALRSGIYLVALRGNGCNITEKVEVVK